MESTERQPSANDKTSMNRMNNIHNETWGKGTRQEGRRRRGRGARRVAWQGRNATEAVMRAWEAVETAEVGTQEKQGRRVAGEKLFSSTSAIIIVSRLRNWQIHLARYCL